MFACLPQSLTTGRASFGRLRRQDEDLSQIAPTPAPICYLEIPAPDVERAIAFYESVFGWTITPSDLTAEPYAMFSTGEGALSGGLHPGRPVRDGGVIIYLQVDDIAATLEAVLAAGGSIVEEKTAIGADYGYSAVFSDPNGNHVGLWCQT
jgi:predicted enzyme related to lactoylglutathione lyase